MPNEAARTWGDLINAALRRYEVWVILARPRYGTPVHSLGNIICVCGVRMHAWAKHQYHGILWSKGFAPAALSLNRDGGCIRGIHAGDICQPAEQGARIWNLSFVIPILGMLVGGDEDLSPSGLDKATLDGYLQRILV